MKVDIASVAAILQSRSLPAEEVHSILDEVAQAAEDEKPEDGPPPLKYAPLLVATTDSQTGLAEIKAFFDKVPVFIMEHVEAIPFQEAIPELKGKVIHVVNQTAFEKNKKKRVTTIGGAFAVLSSKALKDAGMKMRFKEPVIGIGVLNAVEEKYLAQAKPEPEPEE